MITHRSKVLWNHSNKPLAVAAGLILLLMVLSGTAMARPLTQWSASTIEKLRQVRDDPRQVLDTSLARINEAEGIEKVSLHFIASRAYASLILHHKALEQAENGLRLLDQKTQPWLYAYLQLARAEAQKGLGQAREAENAVTEALRWARHNQTYELLAYALSVAGYTNLTLSETDNALDRFQEGYRLTETNNLLLAPADFSGMIALVYESRNEPELAIPYFEKARVYYEQQNRRLELANTLFGLGRSYVKLNQQQKGLELLVKSAQLALDIRDIQGAAYSYQEISQALIARGQLDEAQAYLSDALRLFKQAQNPFQQIGVLLAQAKINLIQRKANAAMAHLEEAISLAKGDAFLPHRVQISKLRAEILAFEQRYEEAYGLLLTMLADDRRLQNEQNSQRLIKLQTAFETEQQRAQNALLREQNLRQKAELANERRQQGYTAIVVTLLAVICLLLLWQHRISKKHQKKYETLANKDGLTGLLTRRKTLEDTAQQLSLAHRHQDYLTLAVLDLDHFKQINDTYGHQAGDDILKGFAALASRSFRGTDILGRIGGEEFLFVFPHTPVDDAYRLLERFGEMVKGVPARVGREEVSLSVSVGLVSGKESEDTAQLMNLADEALYVAKEAGRDCIRVSGQAISPQR